MMRLLVLLTLGGAALGQDLYTSVKAKIEQIENERLPPRAQVFISLAEANAYAREEARIEAGDGVRNPRLELGAGVATGRALIDFQKVQTARGHPPGRLLGWILSGERSVEVRVRIRAANGEGRVDVERVVINNVPVSGRALELLIEYYVVPRYPEAAIGRPFALRHKVETIEVTATGVTIRIKGS